MSLYGTKAEEARVTAESKHLKQERRWGCWDEGVKGHHKLLLACDLSHSFSLQKQVTAGKMYSACRKGLAKTHEKRHGPDLTLTLSLLQC